MDWFIQPRKQVLPIRRYHIEKPQLETEIQGSESENSDTSNNLVHLLDDGRRASMRILTKFTHGLQSKSLVITDKVLH